MRQGPYGGSVTDMGTLKSHSKAVAAARLHGLKRDGWLRIAPLTMALTENGVLSYLNDELRESYLAAVKRGHVSIWVADEVCCKVLCLHPAEIFRGEWSEALAFHDGEDE